MVNLVYSGVTFTRNSHGDGFFNGAGYGDGSGNGDGFGDGCHNGNGAGVGYSSVYSVQSDCGGKNRTGSSREICCD